MPDNGEFRINDVRLNIPPTKISINRQMYNYRYQTLRTRNSIKVKSGHSVISIRVAASFVGGSVNEEGDDFGKLQRIIMQARATPFCLVENQLIRSSIEELSGEPIVLALRGMNIRTAEADVNLINVVFDFVYFNYFPYSNIWQYRQDLFASTSVNIEKSRAWAILTEAEGKRGKYLPIPLDSNMASGGLVSKIDFRYYEYINPVTSSSPEDVLKKYENLRSSVRKEAVQQIGASEFKQPLSPSQSLVDQARDLLGPGTSMEIDLFSDISAKEEKKSFVYRGLDWRPLLSKNKPVLLGGRPLFARRRKLSSVNEGLIVTSIDISFAHILAMMPIVGHMYATYQNIGSSDATLTVNMITTEETPLKTIRSFYDSLEQSALRFGSVPASHRQVIIGNDVVNMCGLYQFMPEQCTIDTIPGSAGVYSISMSFSEHALMDITEKPTSEFATSWDMREKIAEQLKKYIKISPVPMKYWTTPVTRMTMPVKYSLYKTVFYSTFSDSREAQTKAICEEYATLLGNLWNDLKDCFPEGLSKVKRDFTESDRNTLRDILSIPE